MTGAQRAARSVSIDLLDHLQRRWNAVILSGKPNGLAEKPGLLASLTQVGDEFGRLRSELLGALAEAGQHEATLDLGSRAQIAIDILIRNLFERTADVGFLAEDTAIVDSLVAVRGQPAEADLAALRQRLDDYVAKYSVYDDIAIYRADGTLHLTRLAEGSFFVPNDPLVRETLGSPGSFHEVFRPGDAGTAQLLYTQSIHAPQQNDIDQSKKAPVIGVLALSFRFENEMEGIFADLLGDTVGQLILAIIDADGRVLTSSDDVQLAPGMTLSLPAGNLHNMTLAGTEWRALRLPTRGYQGYAGLGWSGVALQPVKSVAAPGEHMTVDHDGTVEREISRSSIVSPGLRRISGRAYAIDTDLHLIGLNGKIAADRENNRVLPAVLASIREVGESIRNAVHGVVGDLYHQSHRHLRQKVTQMTSLGVNILDRNLYERANDCRWWALTPAFRRILAEHGGEAARISQSERGEIAQILAYINGLYTVYSTLLVFDRNGTVVAVSRQEAGSAVGRRLEDPYIRAALMNRDPQSYTVSPFAVTPLYDERPTYIYCGTILAPDGVDPVGGIAVVFDSEPQFRQMLNDVIPLQDDGTLYPGSFAAFVNQAGLLISSTNPQDKPGAVFASPKPSDRVITHTAASQGYREFKRTDGYVDRVTCHICIPV